MKLSVALCTYNGSRHLREQLDSIARQSRPPDELVVCDDVSQDATIEILNDFAGQCEFPVRIQRNERTLGSTKNFEHAITVCDGDVIALCDQDDVWEPRKLALLEDALARHPEAAYVFSDAHVVDECLQPLGHTLWEAVGFGRREQRLFEGGQSPAVLLRFNVVTGATMALRACHRDLILPIPGSWIHDGWSALVLSLVAPCAFVDEPLIQYRQHSAQQLGGAKTSFFDKVRIAKAQGSDTFRTIADDYQHVADRIGTVRDTLRDPAWYEEVEKKAEHFRTKARMRDGRLSRLPLVAKEFVRLHYNRYSRGWKSLAQDVFL